MNRIITENRNENTIDIDMISTVEIIEKINSEDKLVAHAVEKEKENIALAVDCISKSFLSGGKLYYFGAGTSGRLGVLDASECPPTFGVSSDMVVGIIAGGDNALRNAIEGAEDDYNLGYNNGDVLDEKDCCVLISAGGNPEYLIGVANRAKEKKSKIIALTCNKEAKILKYSDIKIIPVVGAEVIAGSSRMKAGTAQKMVLNMLTTASMVKIGKTYENFMIDVMPTNIKLKKRAVRIVVDLTEIGEKEAENILKNCNWKVKTAVLMIKRNISEKQAQELLDKNCGVLRRAINDN